MLLKAFKSLVCQTSPTLKQPEENFDAVRLQFQRYSLADAFDLVLFCEMAFTGYSFSSREEIEPFCELAGQGAQFLFLREIALSLDSYVVGGYPELAFVDEQKHFFNSAYVVSRTGELLLNFRKKHLFQTDKPWAEEGSSFSSLELTTRGGCAFRAGFGICMDINPYEFVDSSLFELAEFCKQEEVDLVVLLSAWNDHEPTRNDGKSIEGIVDYWLWRLRPLINTQQNPKNYEKNWAFLCCNRVGKEKLSGSDLTVFSGCSCCIKLNPHQEVYVLDKRAQGYLVAEFSLAE